MVMKTRKNLRISFSRKIRFFAGIVSVMLVLGVIGTMTSCETLLDILYMVGDVKIQNMEKDKQRSIEDRERKEENARKRAEEERSDREYEKAQEEERARRIAEANREYEKAQEKENAKKRTSRAK
jgi:regulator of protease activity HflC (stomatin/prohibitin superfamily)